MLGFLFRRSKKTPDSFSRRSRAVHQGQRQLDRFQTLSQGKQTVSATTSNTEIEDEVNEGLKAFQSRIKNIKETSLKVEELAKMLKSNEIPENAYRLIAGELAEQISMSVEEIFRLREILELARARAKLEWAKEKESLKAFDTPDQQRMLAGDSYLTRELYSPLYKWKEITSKIDAALSSMTMEEEASIIEQYLSLIREGLSAKAGMNDVERGKTACKERLNIISERWASVRRDKIEHVMNLELKASQIKEDVKEIEIRFAVTELDQSTYEYKMSALQGSLRNVEREISEIRNYIDEIDSKIFRCSELIRESP